MTIIMTDTEVNEAVARKLGWEEIDTTLGKRWVFPSEDPLREYRCPSYMDEQAPDYCHSIAAAWEIPLSLEGGRFEIQRFGDKWICIIEDKIETADHPSMAICLAFLKVT